MSETSRNIWLWRHPAPDFAEQHCVGWLNPPLKDRQAADRAAEALAQRVGQAAAIFCSDLKRARQAARPLARRLGLTLQVTAALREINFGDWTGKSWGAIKSTHPEAWSKYMTAWHQSAMPNGESYEELRSRIVEWWLAAPTTGDLVIVGHGGSLRALAAHLCGWTPEEAIAMHLAQGHFARLDPSGKTPPQWNLECTGPFGLNG